MSSRYHGLRIANIVSAIVSVTVRIIMVLACVQAIMAFPNAEQLWSALLLSVAVVLSSIVFLITEISRRRKTQHARPGDSGA